MLSGRCWNLLPVTIRNPSEAEQNLELPAVSSLLNNPLPLVPFCNSGECEKIRAMWMGLLPIFSLTEMMIAYLWVWVSNHLWLLQSVLLLFRLYDCQFKSVKSPVKPKLHCLELLFHYLCSYCVIGGNCIPLIPFVPKKLCVESHLFCYLKYTADRFFPQIILASSQDLMVSLTLFYVFLCICFLLFRVRSFSPSLGCWDLMQRAEMIQNCFCQFSKSKYHTPTRFQNLEALLML